MHLLFAGPNMRFIAVFFVFFIAAQSPAASADDALKSLAEAKTLTCVFQSAVVTNWEGNDFQTRPVKGFSFSIEAINAARGNAKALARGGASHLEMIALPNVRHFLGFTASGDLNVTSVQGQFGNADGGLLTVHSVHMASVPPQTFQHYGICTPKE